MTTARNDTANTREDDLFASVYQQLIGAQALQYEAAYDTSAGLKRFTDWLQDHAAPELEADQAMIKLYSTHCESLTQLATSLVRDPAAAENIVLDAFIAMHRGWARLGDADKALVYLRQAVVNRCRSVVRHRTAAGKGRQDPRPGTAPAEDSGHTRSDP